MPELPDVEIFRQYMNDTVLLKKIVNTEVLEPSLLEDVSPSQLVRRLTNACFIQTCRHGKYLFTQIHGGEWLILHFGMTGYLKYFKNEDVLPKHTRLLVHFDNNYGLAYVCQRKLGKIGWTARISDYIDKSNLGPDALSNKLNEEEFKNRIHGKRGTIKSRLMNQKIIAGLGNIYTDEILFHAGLHPKTRPDALNDDQRTILYRQMRSVLKTAIENKADPEQFPNDSLLLHRKNGETCPRCGGKIQKIKVIGRPTYYCEKHQS